MKQEGKPMKKTLLAVSLSALAAGSANAAVTLNETETGSFSTYGKILLQLNNYDGENEIQDNGSRFGFSGESAINDDLTAFANTEFRFNAGYQNDAAMNVRYSYVGVEGGFGKVTAGNFDSVYYTAVGSATDLMEQDGWRSIEANSSKGEGFSLAYETADLGGFSAGLGLKHYSADASRNGTAYPANSASGDEVWNVQAYAAFTGVENLTVAVAFDQNNEDADASFSGESIMGLSAVYALDSGSVSAQLELEDEMMLYAFGGSFGYGAGDIYGVASMMDDGNETGLDLALGANYGLADNFYVFGEFAQGNDKVSAVGDASSITLGANYNW
jgi:predicted porin